MKSKLIFTGVIILSSIWMITQSNSPKTKAMRVAVWDTYVTKKNGQIMHFDILVPDDVKDTTIIYGYGKEYLATKGQAGQPLTSNECRFCHVETPQPSWVKAIKQKGYYIIEMENCE